MDMVWQLAVALVEFSKGDDPTWFRVLWLTIAVGFVIYRVARRSFDASFYVVAFLFVPLGIFLLI